MCFHDISPFHTSKGIISGGSRKAGPQAWSFPQRSGRLCEGAAELLNILANDFANTSAFGALPNHHFKMNQTMNFRMSTIDHLAIISWNLFQPIDYPLISIDEISVQRRERAICH